MSTRTVSNPKSDARWKTQSLLNQHLGAFPGMPVEVRDRRVRWLVTSDGQSGEFESRWIDGPQIARMQFAIAKLRKECPKDLRRFVDNPLDWLDRIEGVVDHLKEMQVGVQASPGMPSAVTCLLNRRWKKFADSLRCDWSCLSQLLDVLAWRELTRRKGRDERLLVWLKTNAEHLASMNVGDQTVWIQLSLCLVREDVNPRWMENLLRMLAYKRLHGRELVQSQETTQSLVKELAKTARLGSVPALTIPTLDLGRALASHVRWIHR